MPAFASYVVLCVVAPETFFLPYPYPNTYLLLLSMSLVQNKLFCILIFFSFSQLELGVPTSLQKIFICTEIMYAEDFQMLKKTNLEKHN